VTPEFQHIFEVASAILAYIAAISTTAIALAYRIFFAWRLTPAGRVFSQFTLALAAVFILATLVRLFGPDYEFRFLLTTAVFGWWAVTSVRLFVELVRSWRHGEPRLFDLAPKHKRADTGPIPIQKEH
jgi:hypothetical protein